MNPARSLLFAIAALLGSGGCARAPAVAEKDFAVNVRIRADDGLVLAGATIARGAKRLGSTDQEGKLTLRLSGWEGQTAVLGLTCPAGYDAPKRQLSVRLASTRRVGGVAPEPLYVDGACAKQTRDVVLVVSAKGGAGLPILVNGLPAGTTDGDGHAHVLLSVDRGLKSLEVEIDTKARAHLLPRSPTKIFDLDGRDVIALLEQPFSAPRALRAPTAAPVSRKHVPTRID